MMRAVAFFLSSVLLMGCNQQAQSQQQVPEDAAPAVSVSPEAIQDANAALYAGRQNAITQAVEAASPAVVSINVISVQRVRVRDPFFNDPFFGQFFRPRIQERQVQNLGSGFVMSPDGYIVTNDHVAGNATEITVSFTDGKTLPATLVGTDPYSDLALLKVEPEDPLVYLSFADTRPIVGEWVIALGNPFGLFEAAEPTVTVGVVSAVSRNLSVNRDGRIYTDMIQTDAAINRGNSGGPLVNALGEVIGVNSAIYSESGGSIGIGFAVPAEKALRILDELRETGTVDRSYYTGLYGQNVDARIARALDLDRAEGIFVRNIDPNSPADEAGFQPYDVIISFQGEPVGTTSDYLARLYDYRPGDQVQLGVIRDGAVRTLTLVLGRQEG